MSFSSTSDQHSPGGQPRLALKVGGFLQPKMDPQIQRLRVAEVLREGEQEKKEMNGARLHNENILGSRVDGDLVNEMKKKITVLLDVAEVDVILQCQGIHRTLWP